jgi:competence protein ComEC
MKRLVKHFCERHPMFVAAGMVVAAVIVADRIGWLAGGVAILGGLAGWFFVGWRKGLVWSLCAWVAVAVFVVRTESREDAERSLVGSGGHFEAVLSADGRGGGGRWEAPAKLRGGRWDGVHVWWKSRGDAPVAGTVVKGAGNFVRLPGPRNPGEFDEAAWMRRKGVIAVFQGQMTESRTGRWAALGAEIRRGFRLAVTAGLDEDSQEAKVIRAIVIGEAPPDADELVAAFRNSGTLHIFSVSGMHVAMVGSAAWLVLRWVGVSRRWAILALLPLVFGYSWITGNSPPAVRSAWMMAVFLMAFVFRREPDLLNSLGAVLLVVMLWDGNLLFQPGVQLSYGVVAAIAAGTAWASRMFAWMGRREDYLPEDLITGWRGIWLNARKRFATFLGVSTAAWIGSTPLTIWHFGLVTPVALIATGVLGPLVFGLMCLALISAAVHPVAPAAAAFLNRGNGLLAIGCVASAKCLAGLPGSHFDIRSPGEPKLLVYDLHYGAGAACFSGKEGAVMFDCGDRRSFRHKLVRSMRSQGIAPDSVVISHADGGHLGGASEVWDAFPIRQVLLPVGKSRSAVYKRWQDEAPDAGIRVATAGESGELPLPDGASLEIVHVPESDAANKLADERVAVFRIHWRGWKILMLSDAGTIIEEAMVERGGDLTADVIVAGRNRHTSSLGDTLIDAVKPKVVVVSHSEFPVEERFPEEHGAYLRSRGIAVLNQRDWGGVTIRLDEAGNLVLEGFVNGEVLTLRKD